MKDENKAEFVIILPSEEDADNEKHDDVDKSRFNDLNDPKVQMSCGEGDTKSYENLYPNSLSFRIYNSNEKYILNEECQGMLLSLQQHGIIDSSLRELILHKCSIIEHEITKQDFIDICTYCIEDDNPNDYSFFYDIEYLLRNMSVH